MFKGKKEWDIFAGTGAVEDYLRYRRAVNNDKGEQKGDNKHRRSGSAAAKPR